MTHEIDCLQNCPRRQENVFLLSLLLFYNVISFYVIKEGNVFFISTRSVSALK